MKNVLLAFAMLLSAYIPVAAQPTFPQRGVEIIDQLGDRSGYPADDEGRRALTKSIIEQLVCEFPNDGYTWKSSTRTHPPSKDAIGILQGGRLYIWDWQNGTSLRRQVVAGQEADDITGQWPIPLSCVNHLGAPGGGPVGGGGQPPDVNEEELTELHAEFHAFRQEVRERWTLEDQAHAALAKEQLETRASLEEHRAEVRKGRSQVLDFLKNWRTWSGAAAGILGTILAGGVN
jgi:hypothetical protein